MSAPPTSIDISVKSLPRRARVQKVQVAAIKTFPLAVLLASILFGVLYVRDHSCQSLLGPAFRLSDALAEELRGEAGSLVPASPTSDSRWTTSLREAQKDDRELLEKSQILGVLDSGDLRSLKIAFQDVRSASAEIRDISSLLQRGSGSDEEAEELIHRAAEAMTSIREQVLRLSKLDASRPILFQSKSKMISDLRQLADSQTTVLRSKVAEL
jgi:hypothetical protein